MKTIVSYDRHAVDLALDALKARLYVPGWDLNPTLHWIIETNNDIKYGVAVTYDNGIPIAVATTKATWNGMVYVFVRKKYRSNNIGKKIILELLSQFEGSESPVGHANGTNGCTKFFESVGLDIVENISEHQ